MAVVDRGRDPRTITVLGLHGLGQLRIVGAQLKLKRPPLYGKLLLEKLKTSLLVGIESQLMVKNFVQLRSGRCRRRKQGTPDKNTTDRGEEASDNR